MIRKLLTLSLLFSVFSSFSMEDFSAMDDETYAKWEEQDRIRIINELKKDTSHRVLNDRLKGLKESETLILSNIGNLNFGVEHDYLDRDSVYFRSLIKLYERNLEKTRNYIKLIQDILSGTRPYEDLDYKYLKNLVSLNN